MRLRATHAVSRPAAFSPQGTIPGLRLLIGFLVGAILVGQLYLRELETTSELTAEAVVQAEAIEQLQGARAQDTALISLLQAHLALETAEVSLEAGNFGLARTQVLEAAKYIESTGGTESELAALSDLSWRIRRLQVRISDSTEAQRQQIQALQLELQALIPAR